MHDALEQLKGCRGRSCSIRRHQAQLESGSSAPLPSSAINQVHRNNKRKHCKSVLSPHPVEVCLELISCSLASVSAPLAGSVGNYAFVGSRLDMDGLPAMKRRKLSKYNR